jgi:Sulfotransferase family
VLMEDLPRSPSLITRNSSDVLTPILVAGYGRSGTTAVMNLLAAAPQIAFDREYPFENRYLSYYSKLSSILRRAMPDERFTSDHLYKFDDGIFGPPPWRPGRSERQELDWLPVFWNWFSSTTKNANPAANFYAEKAPAWLSSMVRLSLHCEVIHLFRDPRDVYISSNAFMKARHYYGFHREATHTDLDHARNLGLELLNYYENFVWDRRNHPGSLFLRYEDFALNSTDIVAWLRSLGATPDLSNALDHIERHRTTSTVAASVGRWQREEIPPEVCDFLERNLGREMKALGYCLHITDFCPSIEFNNKQPFPELTNAAHGRIELAEDALAIQVTGNDFGLLLPFPPIQASDVREIWMSVAGDVGDHFSVYWRDADSRFSEDRGIHVHYFPGLHWRVVRLRVSEHPLWKGTIHQIRIDLFNGRLPEVRGIGLVRWVRLIR